MDNPGLELDEDIQTTAVTVRQRGQADAIQIPDVEKDEAENKGQLSDLQYGVEQSPPWYLCIVLGFQHYLTMFGATVAIPLILSSALCIGDDDDGYLAKSEIISTIFFISGLVTILQTTFGSRLPIVQGGTFSFLTPAFAILSLPKWDCPVIDSSDPCAESPSISNFTTTATTLNITEQLTADTEDLWKPRMREIQGAIILSSLFEVFVGMTGIVGFLMHFIGPIVIAPTIALIGLSLFQAASDFCAGHWWIAFMTIVLVALFSQYLRNINIPCCSFSRDKRCSKTDFPVFKLFPVIIAILVAWFVCAILTWTDVLPDNPCEWGYEARTDSRQSVLENAKWFRVPYPFQWGTPTFSVAGTFGMLSGVLAGMIESVGDYYACARLAGAPPPPIHAVNRGILVEGIGCVLSGLWGSGTGTTSYSENIGAIGITKVGSRRVVQVGGLIMIILGVFGKFGALFVTIPDPVVGGIFMVMFGMVAAVGISNLQFVDLNSSRNLFIVGFSIFFGLSLPQWVQNNPTRISVGVTELDQMFQVLLSTSMFVGGLVAFVLDNTIPGTPEERGLTKWRKVSDAHQTTSGKHMFHSYDLPFGMGMIRKMSWTRFIPVCPTFDLIGCSTAQDIEDDEYTPTNEKKDFHPQNTQL